LDQDLKQLALGAHQSLEFHNQLDLFFSSVLTSFFHPSPFPDFPFFLNTPEQSHQFFVDDRVLFLDFCLPSFTSQYYSVTDKTRGGAIVLGLIRKLKDDHIAENT